MEALSGSVDSSLIIYIMILWGKKRHKGGGLNYHIIVYLAKWGVRMGFQF